MVQAPRSEIVTTTSTKLISQNPKRTSLLVDNLSAQTVFDGLDVGLTTGKGTTIGVGETKIWSQEFGDDPTLARFFIVAAGTADIRIEEGFGRPVEVKVVE